MLLPNPRVAIDQTLNPGTLQKWLEAMGHLKHAMLIYSSFLDITLTMSSRLVVTRF